MEGEGEELKFNIVLPTIKLPPTLSHLKSTPIPQFLVGYRNLLNNTASGIQWCLIKDSKCCGRAYVYQISEADAHAIQQIKRQGEFIETAGQNYILLCNEKQMKNVQDPLTLDQLSNLFEMIGGVNKINLNLLKNAFFTREDYVKIAGKVVPELGFQEKKIDMSAADQIKMSYNAKTLSGKELLRVPMVSKETGNVVEGEMLELKLQN